MGQYVFDPKAATSSQATKGSYFDQPTREKEVTAKGESIKNYSQYKHNIQHWLSIEYVMYTNCKRLMTWAVLHCYNIVIDMKLASSTGPFQLFNVAY